MDNDLVNTIICGDAIEVAKTLPGESIQMIITSPPYYNLRDYNQPGQFGLEPTLQEYITRLVDLFRELRRTLKDDGTLWLNLGDSYSGSNGNDKNSACGPNGMDTRAHARPSQSNRVRFDLPAKNLMMIPARVAIALQDDGWILRSEIVWHKVAGMPESVTDRPTRAHEMIYLFSKSPRYYYDNMAIRTSILEEKRIRREAEKQMVGNYEGKGHPGDHRGVIGKQKGQEIHLLETGANLRDVWVLDSSRYKGAHFATFPLELPKRCILLGCPREGVVYDPFMGAGTTALAAIQNGRSFLGSELNPEYIQMTYKRLGNQAITLFDCG